MHLKKKFGQHFLKDPEQAKRLAVGIQGWGINYDHLVEIGPGGGVLTQFLVQEVKGEKSLTLIEIDRDLWPKLTENFVAQQVQLVEQDFLKWDIKSMTSDFGVAGNFPYNISSQIVFKILENKERIPEMVGMFQKEVAQRIASGNGTKVYGILSVLVQAYYAVDILYTLRPEAFNPPPKVDSMVIRLRRKRIELDGVESKTLFRVVKAAFNHRRKTLKNSLASILQEKDNLAALSPYLGKRPEQLDVDDFIDISRIVENGYRTE